MQTRLPNLGARELRTGVLWLTIILAVVADQATKAAAREVLEEGPLVFVPGILNLVHVENTGAAFSLGQGGGAFFVLVAIVFIVAAILVVWRNPEFPLGLVVSIGLVAGGGLGNMIDRVMGGSVTDFLATAFMNFPVFNVADICVTVGIFSSIVGYWVWDARREQDSDSRPHTIRHA